MAWAHTIKIPRYAVFLLVLALHAAIWMALVKGLQLRSVTPANTNIVSTLILLQTTTAPRYPGPGLFMSQRGPGLKSPPEVVEPITIVPPALTIPTNPPGPRTDWTEAGQRGVSSMLALQRKRFGTLSTEPKTSAGTLADTSSSHRRGTTSETDGGPRILWISQNCYQVDPPSIPNVPEHALIPTTICKKPSTEVHSFTVHGIEGLP